MSRVFDASAVVAALTETGVDGAWALGLLAEGAASTALLPAEVANVLRRLERAGTMGAEAAALAHVDLIDLPITLYPYAPFAERVWTLRDNLTSYDAWYVAVAEELAVELVTLDQRLAHAPGIRCSVLCPET